MTVYAIKGKELIDVPPGLVLGSRQVFTTTGAATYTTPAKCRMIRVYCIGAGGGGGGALVSTGSGASVGGGGGSGGLAIKQFYWPYATYPYTVGAAGAAASVGNAGGDTFFGGTTANNSPLTAKGGTGASRSAAASTALFVVGGAGGNASIEAGDWLFQGNTGGAAFRASGTIAKSGQGAPGPFGGSPQVQITAGAGLDAEPYGAGGGGGLSINSAAVNGGKGSDGIIWVEEFYATNL